MADLQRQQTETSMRRSGEQEAWQKLATSIEPRAQETYISLGESDFDRLARDWQCEDMDLGLDPTKPLPEEIGQRRMREFWEVWGKSPHIVVSLSGSGTATRSG